MSQRRCDTCEWWDLEGQYPAELQAHKDKDERLGSCRRNAPSPTKGEFEYELLKHLTHLSWNACSDEEKETDFQNWEEASIANNPTWPTTYGGDWCGEWRLAPNAAV